MGGGRLDSADGEGVRQGQASDLVTAASLSLHRSFSPLHSLFIGKRPLGCVYEIWDPFLCVQEAMMCGEAWLKEFA